MKHVVLAVMAVLVLSFSANAQKAVTVGETAKSVSIPIPEPEVSAMKALQDRYTKLKADYDRAVQSVQSEWDKLIIQAAAKSGLGASQLLSLVPDTQNKMWIAKPEPPKTPEKEK